MTTLLLTLSIVALAILLLGVNALFRGKPFPSGHAHNLARVPERQRKLRREAAERRRKARRTISAK